MDEKKPNKKFNLSVKNFNGAKMCELIGMYLLNKMVEIVNKEDTRQYRNEGFWIPKGQNKRQTDLVKKKENNKDLL